VNLTDWAPLLLWLEVKARQFADYLSRWVEMLDPGEDEDDDEHS
jgi:hypothetical protein